MQTPQRATRLATLPSRGSNSFPLSHLLPATTSATQRRLLALHEVDRVLVSSATSRRQGTTFYTLEVYTSSPTASPQDIDAACSKLSDGSDEGAQNPAYHINKTLADFDTLRRALYSASHLAHTSVACEFCKEMILYIDMGDNRFGSSVVRLLSGREKVSRSLQQFVDDVLDILIHFASIEDTPWCSGQVQSHQVVRQFLLPRAEHVGQATARQY